MLAATAVGKKDQIQIHPTAIVDRNAKLAEGVEVGPYTLIGPHVEIKARTKIASHCVIDGWTKIGESCQIFPGACLGQSSQDKKCKGDKSFLIIGDRNIIREYVTMHMGNSAQSKTEVGSDNIIMAYAHVAHDCQIGNHVVIANGSMLAGHVTVEDQATIGGLVGIHQFVRIGRLSIVGGCSKAVSDIPPFSTCDGHPARVYGLNAVGLKRSGYTSKEISPLKKAFKLLFKSGMNLTHAVDEVKREIKNSKEVDTLIEFVRHTERGVSH